MAGDKTRLGPVGQQVVRNVLALAAADDLSLRALSARLGKLGRPVLPSVLHRLAKGARRVDADDLVAFALALNVNPVALLLPRDVPPDAEVELAPEVRTSAWSAWAWADGRMPLPWVTAGTPQGSGERFTREMKFARDARPVFSGHERARAVSEIYELADRVEAYQRAGDDLTEAGALRDRVIRQAREVMLKLEELLADDEDATGQLREAARTLPAPAIDYATRGDGQR